MSKKEEFKDFARKHPELIKQVNTGKVTWQKLYNIYDIYGEEESAWSNHLNTSSNETRNLKSSLNLNSITNFFKNTDMSNVQKHIGTAQKALGFIQDLTTKEKGLGATAATISALGSKPSATRPINKFFED